MSAPLLAAALALLASVPLAGVSRLGGAVVERLTAAPDVRERAWTFLFLLPLAMTVAAVSLAASGGAPQFDSPSAAFEPVLVIVRETAAAPSSAADLALGQAAAPLAAPLLGAAGLGLLARVAAGVHARRRLGRVVARARPCADPALLAALAHEARRRRLGAPPLLISDEVDRPLLAGVRRPVILLPAALARSCSTERLQLICAHELAHLARRDPWRLLGEEAVAGLFWFNPFLPPVRARMSAAREEVCDAQALAGAPYPARRAYAETLVHALRLGAGPEPAFTGAARSTAMRLQAILHPVRPARPGSAAGAAALSALLLAAVGAGSAALAEAARVAAPSRPLSPRAFTEVSQALGFGSGPRAGAQPSPADSERTIAGPEAVIRLGDRQQPDGFVLPSLDPKAIQQLDRTAGPNTVAPPPLQLRMTGLSQSDLSKPGVAASLAPEGFRVSKPGGVDLEIVLDDRVQPAGFDPESIDPRMIRFFRIEPIPAGYPQMRLSIWTKDSDSRRLPSVPRQVLPAAPTPRRLHAPRATPRPEHLLAVVPPVAVQAAAAQQAPKPAGAAEQTPDARFRVTMKAQADEVRFSKDGGREVATFIGGPEIEGVTTRAGQFLIDGQPQPAGFDMGSLRPDTIERVEFISNTRDGRPQTANTDPATVTHIVNLITKRR